MVKSRFATRWRLLVACSAVIALAASVGIWTAVLSLEHTPTPQATVDCSTLEAETFSDANALAAACDADIEVLAERTPWETSWATAENAGRLEIRNIPERVLVDGKWTAMDSSLVYDEDEGSIQVAASVFPMEINAGGQAGRGKPLGSIIADDHRLDVWFPLELPEPQISGSQAVYPLGEGIRLLVSVSVDTTAFLPVVELADSSAARRFTAMLDADRSLDSSKAAGLALEFVTELSDGLSLIVDESSSILAVDTAGDTQFSAPSPIMWDSAGKQQTLGEEVTEVSLTDRTRAPADGDQVADVGVSLAGTTIVISPDPAMLDSVDTVWPVYIDPGFGTLNPTKWVAVRKGAIVDTKLNWSDLSASALGQGTGYCTDSSCGSVFYQRLAWQFSGLTGLSDLAGSDVTAATFNVDGQHSYNCSQQVTTLWRTSSISGFTTAANWNNLVLQGSYGTLNEAQRASCAYGGKGFRGFNALGAAQWAADNNQSVLTLALIVGEANMLPWKRFRHTANLVIDYNRAPSVPTSLQITSPVLPVCTSGVPGPVIASTTPTVSAVSSDPDLTNVQTRFQLEAQGMVNNKVGWNNKWDSGYLAAMASGSRRSAAVPASAGLVDGGLYRWRALAYDGVRFSGWSSWCEFTVDTTAPVAPTILPVATSVPAVYLEGVPGGGVGLAGKFTLDRGGVPASADVVSFSYGFNNPLNSQTATPDATGKAVIDFPAPTTTGLVKLTVQSRDAAGNLSGTAEYRFTVASPTEDAIWTLDEGTGATGADSAGTPARPLTLSGGSWVDGPHALFQSRQGDKALHFNGLDQSAETSAQVVDTTKSFVVSAFVKLDATHGAGPFVALSQGGATQSGFQLGYSPAAYCPGATADCWGFMMPNSVSGGSTTAVFSTAPVREGEWTLLVGEHNATTHTLRLWTCDVGTPDDPAVGEPVRSQATRGGTVWAANGVFRVGRGQGASSTGNWWPGAIDNVRIFSGDVLAESKIRRMCQGAEAIDFGGDPLELDPSVGLPE